MRNMRFLAVLMMLVGIMGVNVASYKDVNRTMEQSADSSGHNKSLDDERDDEGDIDSSEYQYEPPVIPSFVKNMLTDADWWADTVCVVDKKAYYTAYETYGRMRVLYNEDKVLVADPTLRVDSFASGCDSKFYVSVVGQTQLVDFSDDDSKQTLKRLTRKLSSVIRYRHDTIADFGRNVFYSMEVDFPRPSVQHADQIGRWLADKISDSQSWDENIPPLNTKYIGYAKLPNGRWQYKGDVHDYRKIARCASNVYFANVRGDMEANDEDYPFCLFSTLSLRAWTLNQRFVTYQSSINNYGGGVHGYYTERLVSLDHVHNREIDFDYLFNPNSEKEVLNLLLNEAKKTSQYQKWDPNIEYYVIDADEDGNPTGGYTFPQLGLSDEGVVFSFQPYDISCFAAGTFHFTIPYEEIKHLLTARGKWCVGMN